jgi:hypothetical protein
VVAEGLTNREAGERLFLSPHRVDFHLRSNFRKPGTSSRAHLTRLVVLAQHEQGETAVMMVVSPLSARMVQRIGSKAAVAAGMTIGAAGLVMASRLTAAVATSAHGLTRRVVSRCRVHRRPPRFGGMTWVRSHDRAWVPPSSSPEAGIPRPGKPGLRSCC